MSFMCMVYNRDPYLCRGDLSTKGGFVIGCCRIAYKGKFSPAKLTYIKKSFHRNFMTLYESLFSILILSFTNLFYRVATTTVIIQVNNTNDICPEFVTESYSGIITEQDKYVVLGVNDLERLVLVPTDDDIGVSLNVWTLLFLMWCM